MFQRLAFRSLRSGLSSCAFPLRNVRLSNRCILCLHLTFHEKPQRRLNDGACGSVLTFSDALLDSERCGQGDVTGVFCCHIGVVAGGPEGVTLERLQIKRRLADQREKNVYNIPTAQSRRTAIGPEKNRL